MESKTNYCISLSPLRTSASVNVTVGLGGMWDTPDVLRNNVLSVIFQYAFFQYEAEKFAKRGDGLGELMAATLTQCGWERCKHSNMTSPTNPLTTRRRECRRSTTFNTEVVVFEVPGFDPSRCMWSAPVSPPTSPTCSEGGDYEPGDMVTIKNMKNVKPEYRGQRAKLDKWLTNKGKWGLILESFGKKKIALSVKVFNDGLTRKERKRYHEKMVDADGRRVTSNSHVRLVTACSESLGRFNGKTGTIGRYDKDSETFSVMLDKGGAGVHDLKSENLRVLSEKEETRFLPLRRKHNSC